MPLFWKSKDVGKSNAKSGRKPKIRTERSTKNFKKNSDKRNDNGGQRRKNFKDKSTSAKDKTKSYNLLLRKWKPMLIDLTSTSSNSTIPSNASTKRTKWVHSTTQVSGGNLLQNLTDRKTNSKPSPACKLTKPKRKWKTK
jgi:hypothetical protein